MTNAAGVSALEYAEASEPFRRPALLERRPARARILRGRKAILAASSSLLALAARCGQTGEMDQLAYFLNTPDARRKTPWLVLVHEASAGEKDILFGAVLLFEYQTLLGGTRVFSSADGTGRRNVLALPEARPRVAAVATRALMARRARIVHLAFNQDHHDRVGVREENSVDTGDCQRWTMGRACGAVAAELANGPGTKTGRVWAMDEQEMPLYLPLASTYEGTLASIGQKTRANLRYYRRRCEAEFGCTFTADAQLGLEEFLQFNRRCTYAVSDELAAWRHQMLGEGTFLCGIAAGLGRNGGTPESGGAWLSLVGGRRQNGYTEIDWQMNRADLPASSLSTVVRAYLIEDEVRRGSTRLYIEGGTPHSIRQSFVRERIFELTAKRNSASVRFLERFASVVFPPKNYLAQTLAKDDLTWNGW